MAPGQDRTDLRREGIRTVEGAREALRYEAHRYNQHQIHSTTGEIPIIRFERAIKEGRHLFRPFKVPFPFESTKDILCIKEERTTDASRKISIDGLELRLSGVDPREKVELRMVPTEGGEFTEIRIWHKGRLTGTQKVKTADLKTLRF